MNPTETVNPITAEKKRTRHEVYIMKMHALLFLMQAAARSPKTLKAMTTP